MRGRSNRTIRDGLGFLRRTGGFARRASAAVSARVSGT